MNDKHFVNKETFDQLRQRFNDTIKNNKAKLDKNLIPSLTKLNNVRHLVTVYSVFSGVDDDLEVVCCVEHNNGLEGLRRVFNRVIEYCIKDNNDRLLPGLSFELGFRNSPLYPKEDSKLVKVHYDKPQLLPVFILTFRAINDSDKLTALKFFTKAVKSL